MTLSLRTAAQIVVGGVLAALVVWVEPAVAVTAPQTLAERVPVQAGPVEPGFAIGHVGVLWETDVAHDDVAESGAGAQAGTEGTEPHGAVRFRHAGVWGPWTPLIEDGIDAPGRWASGLVPGGRADAYQLRGIPADAADARAVAINTTDGPPVTIGTRPGGAARAVDSARCQSRADWGADETLRAWSPEFYPVQVMTVHHTATQNGDPDPEATVRAIYRYHAVDQGWGDIGYQYLVDESGVVYEGRWSGTASTSCETAGGDGSDFAHEPDTDTDTDRMVTGAHTGGWNSGNLGLALLGEFTTHRRTGGHPAAPAVESLEDVMAELAVRHTLDPLATVIYVNPVNEDQKSVQTIGGHRDYTATECPGQRLYDLLPTIRKNVSTKMGTSADRAPAVEVTNPVEGATVVGTVEVRAQVTDDVGVTRVEFAVDGEPVWTDENGADGWSTAWDSTTVADGSRTVTATATDSAGQTGSDAVVVAVDNVEDPATVHVADLDGSVASARGQWTATARIAVAGLGGTPATVHGTWTATGTAVSCLTGGDGTCSVTSPPVAQSTASLTFAVTDVDHPATYDPGLNTDPDGDSDGTRITIAKG